MGLARSAFLIVFRIIITIVTFVAFTAIVFGTLFVGNVTITTATTTGRMALILRIVMILHIAIIARFTGIVTIIIGPVTGIRNRRQNRLLEQQRHHRTRIMTDLMAFRQHIDRIKRTFFKRFLIARIIDSTATATTRHLVILIRIFNGTTTATRTILIPLILDLHRAAATSTRRLLIGNLTNIIVGPGRTTTATSRARHTIGIAIITGNSDITGIMCRLRNRQLRLFEQRGRGMLLDFQFQRHAGGSNPTYHTTTATTATRCRIRLGRFEFHNIHDMLRRCHGFDLIEALIGIRHNGSSTARCNRAAHT